MPRYFFHVKGPAIDRRDRDGFDLRDDHDAWSQGVRSCGEMLRDIGGKMQGGDQMLLRIEAEGGSQIAQLGVYALKSA